MAGDNLQGKHFCGLILNFCELTKTLEPSQVILVGEEEYNNLVSTFESKEKHWQSKVNIQPFFQDFKDWEKHAVPISSSQDRLQVDMKSIFDETIKPLALVLKKKASAEIISRLSSPFIKLVDTSSKLNELK